MITLEVDHIIAIPKGYAQDEIELHFTKGVDYPILAEYKEIPLNGVYDLILYTGKNIDFARGLFLLANDISSFKITKSIFPLHSKSYLGWEFLKRTMNSIFVFDKKLFIYFSQWKSIEICPSSIMNGWKITPSFSDQRIKIYLLAKVKRDAKWKNE